MSGPPLIAGGDGGGDTGGGGGGASVVTDPSHGSAAIWAIGRWFVGLIESMAKPNSSLVWLRSVRVFCKKHHQPSSKDELKLLCSVIGVQGVRVINAMILHVVAVQVNLMKEFLQHNQSALRELRRDFVTSTVAISRLQGLTTFMQDVITAGVALAMRERLLQSLGDSNACWAPALAMSVSAAVAAVDPWLQRDASTTSSRFAPASVSFSGPVSSPHPTPASDRDVLTPLFELASDCGLPVSAMRGFDLALSNSIRCALFAAVPNAGGGGGDGTGNEVWDTCSVADSVSMVEGVQAGVGRMATDPLNSKTAARARRGSDGASSDKNSVSSGTGVGVEGERSDASEAEKLYELLPVALAVTFLRSIY